MTSPKKVATARTFTPPRAIVRVLQVVKVLAQKSGPTSLAELSTEFDVPRTSLFAILKGLQAAGYVTFERDHYSLGPEAVKLGHAITQRQSFPASVLPVLEKLVQTTHETVILSTLTEDRHHVMYLSVLESESPLRFIIKVGTRRPLNASAAGQAVLSHLPTQERNRYIAAGAFERFTPGTVATATALRRAIREVHTQHCAMTVDGTVQGAVGLAAPYFSAEGEVMGAVNLAGPTARMTGKVDVLKQQVIRAGEDISRRLGYTGPYPPAPV